MVAGTIPFSCKHGLGGIPETRLKVFPNDSWVRRGSGTGGDCEDPATLEEGNTVSETTIASDRGGGDEGGGPQVDGGVEVYYVDPPAGQGGTDDGHFSGF